MFKTEPSGMSSHLGNPKTWWIFPDTLLLLIFSLISLYSEDMLCLNSTFVEICYDPESGLSLWLFHMYFKESAAMMDNVMIFYILNF